MAKETLQEQVKVLQSYIGGFAKMLKDIQVRVKSLEEMHLKPQNDTIQEIKDAKEVIENTIVVNSEAV